MESHKKIETLLEKYFEGNTTIAEEKELQSYFSAADVAPNLEQYKPLFGYFSIAKAQQFEADLPLRTKKRNAAAWVSVAASVAVLLGAGTYAYFNYGSATANNELGTYESPEMAFRETQKALALLSGHVNTGVEGVQYLQEYEQVKESVFPAH